MKEKIVVIGGGGHAKVIINILKKLDMFDIIGYSDINNNGEILGIKYLGNDEILSEIILDYKNCNAVIGIGNISISDLRKRVYVKVKKLGFEFPPVISPNAIINEDVTIGEGTVVFDGAIINNSSKIGKCAIINTSSIIEHDCNVGDFVHITPCSILSYGVNIGNDSFIGSGTVVIHNLKITNNCLIGSGSIVIKNILKKGKYWGIPVLKRN